MRVFFVTLFILWFASPAFACHHFRHWAYPWPQRCWTARTPVRFAPEPKLEPILIPPGWDEDEARRDAVEKLKVELPAAH